MLIDTEWPESRDELGWTPEWQAHAKTTGERYIAVTASPEQLLRTSERSDFKRCPYRWEQVWLKGLRRASEPVWAWFGTAIHAGLEAYYPIGKHRGTLAEAIAAFYDSVGEQTGRIWQDVDSEFDSETFEAEIVNAKELGPEMLKGYVELYEGDKQWEVIHTEQPFQINVPDPRDESKTLVVYAGTWDSLMRHRYTKEFWIWDHKARKSFPTEGRWEFYNINDQAGSYLWVAPEVLRFLGVFGKKDTISGLVFNNLKKHMPDIRPRDINGKATNKPKKQHYIDAIEAHDKRPIPNGKWTLADFEDVAKHRGLRVLGDVSANQPGPLFHREEIYRDDHERVTQGQRVQQEALAMNMMRSGELIPWKTPTEDCMRCPIFDMCELDEQDPEAARVMARTMFRKVDVYRDHREAMKLKGGVSV